MPVRYGQNPLNFIVNQTEKHELIRNFFQPKKLTLVTDEMKNVY